MSALWAWGARNGKLRTSDNPFRGTLPPKARKEAREPRGFTDTEAAQVLLAAREQVGFMRWLPWVLCLTGARLNEIGQANKTDLEMRDGVPVFRIHNQGDGRSVKNADSRRAVPLHPALVAEGFLDYVAAPPAGSPLWPDVKPDAVFGLRSVTAGRKVGRWLRTDLGITDPLISPNHSWRHWFIGACRRVVMPIEVRSAITGHSAKMDESAGYGDRMGTFVQVVAAYMAKVACPLNAHPKYD
jgi:integrase